MKLLLRLWKHLDCRDRVERWYSALRSRLPAKRRSQRFLAPRPEMDLERMLRLAQWCVDGRQAGAELELYDWQRRDHAPPAARVLLAALLARTGRLDEALHIIRSSTERQLRTDPATGQILLALLTAADLAESARHLAYELHEQLGDDPLLSQWISWMEQGRQDFPPVSDATARRLAAELLAQPQVVVAVVAAQRLTPQPQSIMLLRRALALALRENAEAGVELMMSQALAELALLAGDHDDARRWARRGLKIEPYRVSLALLLAKIEDDALVGPPVEEILTGAAAQHPDYPDVQAALIHRYRAQGRTDDARNHLAWWLAHSPDNPHARKIEQELAA